MIYDYFHKNQLDETFYDEYIFNRLPAKILDIHTHINRSVHLSNVPPERIKKDWAMQGTIHMSAKDAHYYFNVMFPGIDYRIASFPWPIKEADLIANNEYVAECANKSEIEYGFMCITPDMSLEYINKQLTEKMFAGVKPYPDFVAEKKGADISIFDFLPMEQLSIVNDLNKCIMLHLPRSERLASADNVRELLEIRQKFPNLKIIIAHFGRCFNSFYFEKALELFGSDINGFYFDSAAVLNPDVYKKAFCNLSFDNIMYGSDEPIFLWHGKRRWTEKGYFNLCREDFPWNTHEEGTAAENEYTFFVYEQMNSILNTFDLLGFDNSKKENFFFKNADNLLQSCTNV